MSSCNRKRLLSKTSSKVSPAPERRSLNEEKNVEKEVQIEKLDVDLHKQNSRLLSSGEKSNISKIDSNPCFELIPSSHASVKSKFSNNSNSSGAEQNEKSFNVGKERLSTETTCDLDNFDDTSIVVEANKNHEKVEIITETKEKKSKLDFKNMFNFKTSSFKRKRRNSLLYGLGSKWCVVHPKVWKYVGSDEDEEIITRRKCISLILGSILIVLFLAIILSIVIGLAGGQSDEKPTEAPLQFVVIAAEST